MMEALLAIYLGGCAPMFLILLFSDAFSAKEIIAGVFLWPAVFLVTLASGALSVSFKIVRMM